MRYLSNRLDWDLEVDETGARLKRTYWHSEVLGYGCTAEETLVEVTWGDMHRENTFKDLCGHRNP